MQLALPKVEHLQEQHEGLQRVLVDLQGRLTHRDNELELQETREYPHSTATSTVSILAAAQHLCVPQLTAHHRIHTLGHSSHPHHCKRIREHQPLCTSHCAPATVQNRNSTFVHLTVPSSTTAYPLLNKQLLFRCAADTSFAVQLTFHSLCS